MGGFRGASRRRKFSESLCLVVKQIRKGPAEICKRQGRDMAEIPMATIQVDVEWLRGLDVFVDNQYSRVHRWTFDGGAEVIASSSPEIVPVPMSDSAAVDPEEAFVAAISSCHMLWFLSLAAKRGIRVNRYRDQAVGTLGRNLVGKLAMLTVRLRPVVEWDGESPDGSLVSELHELAHQECFIANSVRTEVTVELP